MGCDPSLFPDDIQKYQNLHKSGEGFRAACPFHSGSNGDRLVISQSAVQPDKYIVWCRQCGMTKFIPIATALTPTKDLAVAKKVEIPMGLVMEMAASLGSHRSYFTNHGLSDAVIGHHLLGWSDRLQRYAIPAIEDGIVKGIQFRASRPDQECRYTSYKGGNNKVLFNSHVCSGRSLPVLYVVEGPRDSMALESLGIPAVAPFNGNGIGSWQPEWNKHFSGVQQVVIVADNDENGPKLALYKKSVIFNSMVVTVPSLHKDVGEMIDRNLSLEWLPFIAVAKEAYRRYDMQELW